MRGESSRDSGEGIGDGGLGEGRIEEGCSRGRGRGFGPKTINPAFDALNVGDDAGEVTVGVAERVDRGVLEDDGVEGPEEAMVGVINGAKTGVIDGDGAERVGANMPI